MIVDASVGSKCCKLCGQVRQLRKSHIVPEFCFRSLYNEKHKFIQLSNDPCDRTITRPQGLYDLLLCGECEARMAVYENYFKSLISDGNLDQDLNENIIKVTGVDSDQLKFFTVSVIWRYYVSKFRKCDFELGPHADYMKRMLLNSESSIWHKYGFIWIQGISLPASFSKAIMLPINKRIDGHRAIMMVMFGLFWVIFTSKHANEHRLSEYFCRDGLLFVINDDEYAKRWFSELAADLNNKGKLDFHF